MGVSLFPAVMTRPCACGACRNNLSAALTSFRKEPNMTTWLIRCFAFLLLMLPFVPAGADDPDDKEIARLVKQLGSSDYRTREVATKREILSHHIKLRHTLEGGLRILGEDDRYKFLV